MKIKAYSTSLVLSVLVSINDANVLELILKNSTELKQLNNKALQADINQEKVDANYNFYLNADISSEKDNTDLITSPLKLDQNKQKQTLTLGKNFLSGTQVSVEGTHFDYQSGLTSLTNYNQNYLALNIQQSIYPNFLGSTERSSYKAVQSQAKRDQLQLKVDEIELVKNKIANYSKAKVLKIQTDKNRELLKKYEFLNVKILKKNKNGLDSPGELEQAQAEIIQREQNLKDDLINLSISLQQLKEDLALAADQDIQIDSEFKKTEIEINRTFKIENTLKHNLQIEKTQAAQAAYDSANSKNSPEVSLYGKYTQQGLESAQSEAFSEFNQGDRNKYLIGLKLNYSFGSDINSLNFNLRKSELDIEIQKTAKLNADLKKYFDNLSEKLNSSYRNIETAKKILRLRLAVIKKIETTYNQGRTDISILIEAYNKVALSEINLANAFAQYNQICFEYHIQTK